MLTLQMLQQLLTDPQLRQQVSRVITNKIRADVKALETSAQLSRRLGELAAQPGSGDATVNALRVAVKEHLDYYETLVNLTQAFNDQLMERLRGEADKPAAPASGPTTMNLTAPKNVTVRAPFHLENNKSAPISVAFTITPFASEDGAQLVSARTAFDPPAMDLQPGQEGQVSLIIEIGEDFRPETTYFSTVTVTGLEGTQLLVRLNVEQARAEPTPPPEVRPAAVPAPKVAARPSRRKSTAKKKKAAAKPAARPAARAGRKKS